MKLFRKSYVEKRGTGIIIFHEVSDVFRAEKVLQRDGYEAIPVAPPMKYRKGCDLAIQFELALRLGIERCLQNCNIPYLDFIALNEETTQPTRIIQCKDFDNYTMVKAGNMKLSFHKDTGEIVNISGGGCPDVPYLHAMLIGKILEKAPAPKELGYTLCALMLQRAFEEAISLRGKKDAFNCRDRAG